MNELIRREIRKEGLDATVKCIVEMYGELGLVKALGACKVRPSVTLFGQNSSYSGHQIEEHQFFFDLSKDPPQRLVQEYKPPLNFGGGQLVQYTTHGAVTTHMMHFTFEAMIQ